MNYIFNDGEIKKSKRIKKRKKKFDNVLICSNSFMFGKLYYNLNNSGYNKLCSTNKAILEYKFLDGSATDDDEIKDLSIKYRYTYLNILSFLSKILEIYISENIFNDSFWVYDSFYCYMYHGFKIKLFKNDEYKKYNNINLVIDYFNLFKEINTAGYAIYKNKYYELDKMSDFYKAYKKFRYKGKFFIQLYPGIYVRINPTYFKDIKNIKTSQKISYYDAYTEDYDVFTARKEIFDKKQISEILELYYSKSIFKDILPDDFKIKSKLLKINNEKSDMSLKEFINKYFYI